MMLAQHLYERGFITYMRTDSVNLAEKFLTESRAWLIKELGEKYAATEGSRRFKGKQKNAQEAHEAIRPTDAATKPEALEGKIEPDHLRLYDLIWRRAIASQMSEAVLDQTSVALTTKGNDGVYDFRANGMIVGFDGYYKFIRPTPKKQSSPTSRRRRSLNSKNSKAFSILPNRRPAFPTLRSLKRFEDTHRPPVHLRADDCHHH